MSIEIEAKAREVREIGFCILRRHLPRALMDECNQAFAPTLDDHMNEIAHNPNRGPRRHYIALPLVPPFYDPRIFDDDAIVAIVERLLGADMTMAQYATDTPLEQNQIYQLKPDTGERRAVGQVQQSVFSMATACEGLFLATAIEPSPIHKTPRVHIWFSGNGQQWQEVLAIERDGWDLRLFQYPTAFIAHGPPSCPYVFLSFRGVKAYDGHCLVGRIEGNA